MTYAFRGLIILAWRAWYSNNALCSGSHLKMGCVLSSIRACQLTIAGRFRSSFDSGPPASYFRDYSIIKGPCTPTKDYGPAELNIWQRLSLAPYYVIILCLTLTPTQNSVEQMTTDDSQAVFQSIPIMHASLIPHLYNPKAHRHIIATCPTFRAPIPSCGERLLMRFATHV